MRILFDNGTPRGVASVLLGHVVEEARLHGWDTLRNGELLDAAKPPDLSCSSRPIETFAISRT